MPFLLGSEEHTSELQSPCNLVCRFCLDRKSTRLNSSHLVISYAVFCLKKKKTKLKPHARVDTTTRGPYTIDVHFSHSYRRRSLPPSRATSVHFFVSLFFFFFFNDTATTEIYTLSLHDALPI